MKQSVIGCKLKQNANEGCNSQQLCKSCRGVATGGISVYIPPHPPPKKKQSVQVNFYGVEMTSERLLNMSIEVLYLPQNFIPPNKFLATPLKSCRTCFKFYCMFYFTCGHSLRPCFHARSGLCQNNFLFAVSRYVSVGFTVDNVTDSSAGPLLSDGICAACMLQQKVHDTREEKQPRLSPSVTALQ